MSTTPEEIFEIEEESSSSSVDIIVEPVMLTPLEPSQINQSIKDSEDYETAREKYRKVIDEATLNAKTLSELAMSMDSPARAFEVLAKLYSTIAETTERLVNLQKTRAETQMIRKEMTTEAPPTVVNNNLFVGETKELLDILKGKKRLENNKLIEIPQDGTIIKKASEI